MLHNSFRFVLTSLIPSTLAIGIWIAYSQSSPHPVVAQDQSVGGVANQGAGLAAAQDLSSAFRNVAEALHDSVVSISTKQTVQTRSPRNVPQGLPPGFEDFFGGRRGRPQSQETSGMGSGVIVRADGYILTNNHVVEGADELTVELADGQTVPGTIVGTDPETDLAVIKVDRDGLRPAVFGSSDDIRVGDWVLAIGSPFGLDQTVTAGIISGKNRVQRIIADGNGFEDFLQTDAAINPGNSGGPLVNLKGELVGINTAILSRSGASAGIGFAIPVALAKPVLNSIINTGEVHRGFLGASVVDVTPDAVQDFDLKVNSGGLIGGVLENQPAAKAGLQPGDVITQLDGRPVTGGTQIRNRVASLLPGSKVRMQINRAGRLMDVQVQLGERTNEAMAMFNGGTSELFGAKLVPVTPETARQFGYDNLRSGLIVASVEDEGLAAQADLQVGDVIESAAGVELKSADQLVAIFNEAKKQKQPLRVIVRRGNTRMLLVIR